MEMYVKNLDVLFRRVPAEEVLRQIRGASRGTDQDFAREAFKRYAHDTHPGYSLDELNWIFSHLQSEVAELKHPHVQGRSFGEGGQDKDSLAHIALSSAICFSGKALRQLGQTPVCRMDWIAPWRQAFLALGQDLFVCAYLAGEDIKARRERKDFTWPAVIRTDYTALNMLLDRGLAENHQHLYGSSQSFALSWCCMMNYPEDHCRIGKDYDRFLQAETSRSASDSLLSTRDRVRYACLLRCHLFEWLKSEDLGIENSGLALWQWLSQGWAEENAKNLIRSLRLQYGALVPQSRAKKKYLDYALEHDVFNAAPDAGYRLLAGERSFLYSCFRKFQEARMPGHVQWAFYLYLILKARFRGELIQVNRQVGFQNFADYQDRKLGLFEHHGRYRAELIRMALNAPMEEENVRWLETRISPGQDAAGSDRHVREVDKLKRRADERVSRISSPDFPDGEREDAPADDDLFYVFHFIKRKDDDSAGRGDWGHVCRHRSLRDKVKKQAIGLAKGLTTSKTMWKRVRGIDSASNEIGCSPEVFAQAFRFMRGYSEADFEHSLFRAEHGPRRLSFTYHVGEDFLDIAGALRNIDDAVNLLELERGDRIGHALGLGISPELHYRLKGRRMYMSKQERLDDIVWLLYRGRELGVHIDPDLYGKLKKDAEVLLMEIYGKALEEQKWHITLTDYHCIMQLRGDAPACYADMKFREPSSFSNPYDRFAVSCRDSALAAYRDSGLYAGMYYYYHYNQRVKTEGSLPTEVVIEPEYIRLIEQAQAGLQEELERKGIIIECNPSSNTLIGTFRDYRHHPIFRLYNSGLELEAVAQQACTQMQVCVNTDDLGVFDTSLEFEYALLFNALNEWREPDGTKRYKPENILRYLESIREMGIRAVFPEADAGKTGAAYRTHRGNG